MGETILVVDDDAAIRKVAKRVLELHGYLVISVGTADEAHRVLGGIYNRWSRGHAAA